MSSGLHLIVFTRFPVPGEAKTRLIPVLGPEGAAALQREMTEHIVRQARRTGAEIEIRFAGGSDALMRRWLGDDLRYAAQGDGDLGERMARAFREHFEADAQRVVIIGGDCPSNHWKNIRKSFKALETSDVVIGPAADGGYYLIGLSRFVPGIFLNVDWGSEQVLEQTLAAAPGQPVLLPVLNDVDRPEDIPSRLSVIVPTLNEAGHISRTVEKAKEGFRVECIVADGGSRDETVALARRAGAITVAGKRGRAAQMNVGAAQATGEILLFLHADTDLPDGFSRDVRTALRDPAVAAGAFFFQLDADGMAYRVLERLTNWRACVLQMPYGDQALFMKAAMFNTLGGFPDLPVMEDVEMVRRLRCRGRMVIIPASAVTSPRRWQERGFLKTMLLHQWLIAGYYLGVSPHRLAKLRAESGRTVRKRKDD